MSKKPVLRWSRRRWIAETLKVKLDTVKPLETGTRIPQFAVEGKTVFIRLPSDHPEDVTNVMGMETTWNAQQTFVNPKVTIYVQAGA